MTISHWAGGELFALSLDGASTGDVAIETTGGFSVGDDLSTAIDGFPEDQVARPGGSA
ncbi:MAG: hypothetical protein JWM51_235, partial [Microbacteriaceae bacterium]|nr:hypothetical protein [Microbacteriaceae bacterium]